MKKLTETPTKIIFQTDTPHVHVERFKNASTTFNVQKPQDGAQKGELNNRMAGTIFRYLEGEGVPSYYLDSVNTHDMRVRAVEDFPVQLTVRSIVSEGLAQRLGVEEGLRLLQPIVELSLRSEELGDPLINADHALHVLKIATQDQLRELRRLALQAHQALERMWEKTDLTLVDSTLAFGTTVDGQIVLAQELTPDTLHLWARGESSGVKEVFAQDVGDLATVYQQVYARLETAWPSFAIGELAPPQS